MSAPSDLPADPPADVRFADLALGPRLLVALEDLGYESPTPIQARTIPALLAGRDLIGQAQTGTGKTAAFALPLLERIDAAERTLQVLVLTPTRELAIQVSEAFRGYASKMRDVEILAIYGGQDYGVQLRALKRGPQIIVGTPGRVMDHMERGAIQLDTLTALVLDEADEMLRMGFIDDVEWILARTPPTRQLALFSATMPAEIRRIAHSYLRDPLEIRLETRSAAASTVHQRVWMVQGVHKLDALTRMLEVEPFDAAIVFVRTRNATVEIAEQLLARGFDADALHGEIPQRQRERIIERLRAGELDILVATDVAARGLDVERVSHVINYDMPYDTEAYVHRIGRTGRAGRAGTAILFAAQRERHMLRAIERSTGRAIELMPLPDQTALSAVRAERFFRLLDDTIAAGGLESRMELIARYRDERGVDPLVIAAALADQMRPPRPREARAPAVQTNEPGPINEPARARRTFQPAPAPDGDVLAPERFSHRDDDRPRSPPTRSGDGARTSRRASGRDAADAFEL
ncbi:MAG: DEAD/DEAH box helicase, partial [Gammaproteobacteria bacterium]